MFNRSTRQRPRTGFFQIAVWTVRPFHAMSRGRPTFTESIRAMSLLVGGDFSGRCAWEPFGDGEVAIRAVRKHRLTRLETDLDAVDFHGNDVRLEGHEVGDA